MRNAEATASFTLVKTLAIVLFPGLIYARSRRAVCRIRTYEPSMLGIPQD